MKGLLLPLLLFSQVAFAVQPRLVADPKRIDFGVVEEGAIVEREFMISNQGEGNLEISRIVAPCGCTIPEMEKRTLAQGESAPLKIKFETRGFFGTKTRSVRVYTNEGENHSVQLELVGEVKRAVSVTPPRLNFDDVLVGTSAEQTIKVKVNNPQIKLGLVSTRSKAITVESQGGDESEKTISVRLLPTAPKGILRTTVAVAADGGATVQVPVFARVVSELQFTPEQLSFGLMEYPSAPTTRRVQFKNIGQAPANILTVTSDNPSLDISYRELSAGRSYELELTFRPMNEGSLRAQITVKTDKGDALLPVSAVVAAKGE